MLFYVSNSFCHIFHHFQHFLYNFIFLQKVFISFFTYYFFRLILMIKPTLLVYVAPDLCNLEMNYPTTSNYQQLPATITPKI